jgi:hypothetical protein
LFTQRVETPRRGVSTTVQQKNLRYAAGFLHSNMLLPTHAAPPPAPAPALPPGFLPLPNGHFNCQRLAAAQDLNRRALPYNCTSKLGKQLVMIEHRQSTDPNQDVSDNQPPGSRRTLVFDTDEEQAVRLIAAQDLLGLYRNIHRLAADAQKTALHAAVFSQGSRNAPGLLAWDRQGGTHPKP